MDTLEEKSVSDDTIHPEHHPTKRQHGPLPSVPATVRVITRAEDCYDSGVGELKNTTDTVPFYEGLNTLGAMETDVDGEVAYSVNYSTSSMSGKAKDSEPAYGVRGCSVAGTSAPAGNKREGKVCTCACVSMLMSATALLLVLATISCGLLVYFGVLPIGMLLTASEANTVGTPANNQSNDMAKQLERLTTELAALQATTSQLSTAINALRASLNVSNATGNGSSISSPLVRNPQSYPATLANLTLFQNCSTRQAAICYVRQEQTACVTSDYTLSAENHQTVTVFCATANNNEPNPVVATLDLANNIARCLCNIILSQQTTSTPTACTLYALECPFTDSFATVIQT